VYRTSLLVILVGILAACGGTAGSKSPANPPPPPPNLGGGSVAAPVVVTVAAGQAVTGINLTVETPASTPPPNAQVLGVANLTGPGEAFNTGGAIPRGSTKRVLLFGPGLSGTMTVTITGPNDITISGIQSIKATDGTSGVAFTAAAVATASLGCRTVVLQATNGDITTFTGGLEVVP
jgi:hypothetical protein